MVEPGGSSAHQHPRLLEPGARRVDTVPMTAPGRGRGRGRRGGSALIAKGWASTVARQRDERLDRPATARTVTISSALASYESALQAARSLYLASDSISRREFSTFARSLDLKDRYPGLQAIGWRSVVTDDEADEFVARNRADREPTFTIRPPGRRPVYYVTVYRYPRIPSSTALGADARATPSILATLERARDTGATTMSNQTTLPGDQDLPAGRRAGGRWPSSCSCRSTESSSVPGPRWPSGAGGSSAGRPGSSGPATSSTRRCGPRPRSPGSSCTTRTSAGTPRWPATRPGSGPPGPMCASSSSRSAGAGSRCATRPFPATPS